MSFLRLHWFDLGMGLAVVIAGGVLVTRPTGLGLLLWFSLITLFLHQFEEYRYPGWFPGMMNTAMFGSAQPDRYPLNAQTALMVNVAVGWLFYFLAAVFAEKALWLGIATVLVSAGNFVAHTFLFNVRGRTRYNPGMVTADVLFLPVAMVFFYLVVAGRLATPLDWIVGLALGGVLNYVGIIKMIDWMKDPRTPYAFPARCLPPKR